MALSNLFDWNRKAAASSACGAGAGLFASAGFTYSGERSWQYFGDFEERYGFHDMYAGGFYPYQTPEEHWAYWSRYIQINRYENAPTPVLRVPSMSTEPMG